MKLSCGSAKWRLFFFTFHLSLLVFLFAFFSLGPCRVAKERGKIIYIFMNKHIRLLTAGRGKKKNKQSYNKVTIIHLITKTPPDTTC